MNEFLDTFSIFRINGQYKSSVCIFNNNLIRFQYTYDLPKFKSMIVSGVFINQYYYFFNMACKVNLIQE